MPGVTGETVKDGYGLIRNRPREVTDGIKRSGASGHGSGEQTERKEPRERVILNEKRDGRKADRSFNLAAMGLSISLRLRLNRSRSDRDWDTEKRTERERGSRERLSSRRRTDRVLTQPSESNGASVYWSCVWCVLDGSIGIKSSVGWIKKSLDLYVCWDAGGWLWSRTDERHEDNKEGCMDGLSDNKAPGQ
uniref:Uncharacterized protein n=1 Tax=Brassica oleracea TaxID=3712 RepID=A0A3P6B5T8_BRAOL|nr:unnamed protein product [Brassica oleracea]